MTVLPLTVLTLFPHDRLGDERRARCCDDERDLLLDAAWRGIAEERSLHRRDRARRVRRFLGALVGWPYAARRRRIARALTASHGR